jgi:hypothetical protein
MRRWLTFTVLLGLCTACPETWRREGTIDRAMEKDIEAEWREHWHSPDCHMSDEDWAEMCDDRSARGVTSRCPVECRP